MHFDDDVSLLMANERIEEARRIGDQRRALRRGRITRPPLRVRLGATLIRLGRRLTGEALREPEPSTGT